MNICRRVREFIEEECLVQPGSKMVVAVSGGVDSVVLLHLLRQIAPVLDLTLTAAHLNHGIRGQAAEADQRFVEALCKTWKIPLTVDIIPPGALRDQTGSLEDVARRARLRFLRTTAEQVGASAIALGHHQDDQVETVMMALFRGAGTGGISGMLPRRGPFIHPLLTCSKEEIERYANEEKLEFVQDVSNRDLSFSRNWLRHELLPRIEAAVNPRVKEQIGQTAEILRQENALLQRLTGQTFYRLAHQTKGRVTFPRDAFLDLPRALRRRLIRLAYQCLTKTLKDLTFTHVAEVGKMVEKEDALGTLDLPNNIRFKREYEALIFTTTLSSDRMLDSPAVLLVPGRLLLPRRKVFLTARRLTQEQSWKVKRTLLSGGAASALLVTHAFIDYNKVNLPLRVRFWRPGDRMRPLGMKGRKKLQDLFVDKKIPRQQRSSWPLITDGAGIVWVPGMTVSDDYRVDRTTCCVLHLQSVFVDSA